MRPRFVISALLTLVAPRTAVAQFVPPLMVDPPDPWSGWSGLADEPQQPELARAQQSLRGPIEGCLSSHRGMRIEDIPHILVAFRNDGRVIWTQFDRNVHVGPTLRCMSTVLHRVRLRPFRARYFVVVELPATGAW